MRRVVTLVACAALTTCASPASPPLFPAGHDQDEGHGELARASTHLMTGEGVPELDPSRRDLEQGREVYSPATYNSQYGGSQYGGLAYGGVGYANYQPPQWSYPMANRNPTYETRPELAGAIEGTVTWRGAFPKATTACGPIDWLSIGSKRELGGALVYIARVSVGRPLVPAQSEQRPSAVGGVIVKRGCALRPVAHFVTPVPARVIIAGDAAPATLRIVPDGSLPRAVELEAHGRVTTSIKAGVTRIDTADGTVGAAWTIGLLSPAYAMTDEGGRFRLDELAPGTYTVTIWIPPPPTVHAGVLVYGEPIVVQRSVTVGAGSRAVKLDVAVGK